MIKGILYDLDGTVIDSEELIFIIINQALAEKKQNPMPRQLFSEIIGMNWNDVLGQLEKIIGFNADREMFVELFKSKYFSRLNELELKQGFLEQAKKFREMNIKLGIASSSKKEHIIKILETLSITELFSGITGGDEVTHSKPHPEIFLIAAQKIGLKPENCLVFEDAKIGVDAAKAAGMLCVAVPNELTKNQDFSKADDVIGSLNDFDYKMLEEPQ